MVEQTPQVEFQFVNATIKNPSVPQDVAVRALIRKQAMKKASAARRRDGNYGKHNLRQLPLFLFEETNVAQEPSVRPIVTSPETDYGRSVQKVEEEAEEIKDKDIQLWSRKQEKAFVDQQRWLAKLALNKYLPPRVSSTGYELMSSKSGFDIVELSTLATLHVGRATRRAISGDPYQLVHQLRTQKQWSYLSFLPSLYGHVTCLNDAVDCAVARAQRVVSPNQITEAQVISYYLKALDSLQKALDSPKERVKAEVLCATEILGLYEVNILTCLARRSTNSTKLLEPSDEIAWIRHAAGAARLIQLRGPNHYGTEFEKALFMAHSGSIMTEALLNNERCFLEQDMWKSVFRSVVVEGSLVSDRSEIVVSLLILKSHIPGTFVDVTSIVSHENHDPAYIFRMILFIQQLRSDLLDWHDDYQSILKQAPKILPGTMEYDRQCKVVATYLSCIILVNRLLAAMNSPQRVKLELETRAYINQMLDMESEAQSTKSAACLFMAQTAGVAKATIAVTKDWLEEPQDGENKGLVEKWKFDKWCRTMGRSIG